MNKKKGIDRGTLYYSSDKTKIEVQVNCSECLELGGDCFDLERYETFDKLKDFVKYLAEESESILEAIDSGCDIEVVFRDDDREASATMDEKGMLIIAVAGMDELVGKELKECKDKLEKVREIVR